MIDKLLHKYFKIPYKLKTFDDKKRGQPIVYLHGIASSQHNWQEVINNMNNKNCRQIAVDLLGFGESPKPNWLDYNVADHARAVNYTIKKLHLNQPPIIVGHSMGCLVIIELLNLNPKIAKSLLLCSMPIYPKTENDKQEYNTSLLKTNIYYKIYNLIIAKKDLTLQAALKLNSSQKFNKSFYLDEPTWLSFKRSLANTIINQNLTSKLLKIKTPTNLIYGRFDPLINISFLKKVASKMPNTHITSLSGYHEINSKYANKITEILNKEI